MPQPSDSSSSDNYVAFAREAPDRYAGLPEKNLDPHVPVDGAKELTEAWRDYIARRDYQAKHLDTKTLNEPRYQAWNDLIASLKPLGISPGARLVQARIVNGWVNTLIVYDHSKVPPTPIPLAGSPPQKYQTPYDTLHLGTGICGDMTLLKYETLRKLGFRDEDMRLVVGSITDRHGNIMDGHMVLKVDINGRDIILNNNQDVIKDIKTTPPAPNKETQIVADNSYESSPGGLAIQAGNKKEKFFPNFGINGNGVTVYDYSAIKGSTALSVARELDATATTENLGGTSHHEFAAQYNRALEELGQPKIHALFDQAFRLGYNYIIPPPPLQSKQPTCAELPGKPQKCNSGIVKTEHANTVSPQLQSNSAHTKPAAVPDRQKTKPAVSVRPL